MCFDWGQEKVLKPNYQGYLTISLLPCDKKLLDDYGLELDDECITDKELQKAYLDPY